ncbi:hypothetical protein GOV05_03535 [Candidatus Woesearchaeota archaeon]|nr:hypothetical protein [Candidatus Woesearchaeota archaeon]
MAFFNKKDEDSSKSDPFTSSTPPSSSHVDSKPLDLSGKGSDKLVTEVEKLKAQAESNSEMRNVYSERFSNMDEKFGELRAMITDTIKDVEMLGAKAEKASDMVSELQPEKIMEEVEKGSVKYEKLNQKILANQELLHNVLEELKEVRQSVRVFRGVEQASKLVSQINKDLVSFEKIQGVVESRADKTEALYSDFTTMFDEFKDFKKMIKNVESKVSNYEADFFKIKEQKGVSEEDFMESRKDIGKVAGEIENFKKKFNKFEDFFMSFRGELKSDTRDILKLQKKLDEGYATKKDFANVSDDLQHIRGEMVKTKYDIVSNQKYLKANNDVVMQNFQTFFNKELDVLLNKIDNVNLKVHIKIQKMREEIEKIRK